MIDLQIDPMAEALRTMIPGAELAADFDLLRRENIVRLEFHIELGEPFPAAEETLDRANRLRALSNRLQLQIIDRGGLSPLIEQRVADERKAVADEIRAALAWSGLTPEDQAIVDAALHKAGSPSPQHTDPDGAKGGDW